MSLLSLIEISWSSAMTDNFRLEDEQGKELRSALFFGFKSISEFNNESIRGKNKLSLKVKNV